MEWEIIGATPSIAALWGALKWALSSSIPGAAWAWALRGPEGSRPSLSGFTRTLIAGLILNLTAVLTLGANARYTRGAELALLIFVTAVGAALGRRRIVEDLRGALGAMAMLAAGALLILALPRRGEWILGGWDPGVYMHQGISLERHGSLRPLSDPFFEVLQSDEVAIFTRPEHASHIVFPGVSLNPERRELTSLFPHAMPAWIARAYRYMGLRGALRVNHLATWVMLCLAMPAARSLGLSRRAAWLTTVAFVVHPVFIHHTAFPTAELLHVTFLQAIAALWAVRRGAGPAIGLSALMGLAVVNRPSFLPFGALLVLMAALDEARDARRRAVRWRRLLQIGALAASALFVMRWNGPLLVRWGATTTLLGAGFAFVGVAALLVDLAASVSKRIRRRAAHWAASGIGIGMAMLACVAALASTACRIDDAAVAARAWTAGALVYVGGSFLVAALFGWLLIGLRRDVDEIPLRGWMAYLLCSIAPTLAAPQITIWWPWASRRLLEAVLPAVALGLGALLDRLAALWPATHARWRPVAVAAALGLITLPAGPRWWHAVHATEYDGATAALAPVIAALGPRDVVVADHFWWGAPIRFLTHIPVINGELFWAAEDEGDRQRLAMRVLRRLHQEGWRIRLLTSTEQGLDLYPLPWTTARLDVEGGSWRARELLQHPRARRYQMRERLRRFRLFTWIPAEN